MVLFDLLCAYFSQCHRSTWCVDGHNVLGFIARESKTPLLHHYSIISLLALLYGRHVDPHYRSHVSLLKAYYHKQFRSNPPTLLLASSYPPPTLLLPSFYPPPTFLASCITGKNAIYTYNCPIVIISALVVSFLMPAATVFLARHKLRILNTYFLDTEREMPGNMYMHTFFAQIAVFFAQLLIFGLGSPFVALAIAVAIVVTSYFDMLKIGHFLWCIGDRYCRASSCQNMDPIRSENPMQKNNISQIDISIGETGIQSDFTVPPTLVSDSEQIDNRLITKKALEKLFQLSTESAIGSMGSAIYFSAFFLMLILVDMVYDNESFLDCLWVFVLMIGLVPVLYYVGARPEVDTISQFRDVCLALFAKINGPALQDNAIQANSSVITPSDSVGSVVHDVEKTIELVEETNAFTDERISSFDTPTRDLVLAMLKTELN